MISALEVRALSGQGGAASLFKTLEGYGRRGHRVDFIAPRIGANHHHGAPAQPPPDIEGVHYHLFDLPSAAGSRLPLPAIARKADQKLRFANLFPLLAARKAERLFRQGETFDVLYGYEVHGVLAQRRVRDRHPLPLVARFQGTVMYPYLRRPHSLLRKFEEVRALKTPADLYIMTDDGTQGDEVLQALNPESAGKVRFWRNGLDVSISAAPTNGGHPLRPELGLSADDFVLVTATRLARWKRVDRAVDAVAVLRDQGVKARLLVVGDGEERANLQRQAQDLGIAERVTFVGAVPQPEVSRYLEAADVFMSVNELSNVGNPLLEAMVAGRCVLTLNEGDTRDLVRDGETGILLPAAGDPGAIAGALAQLATDPERRKRLGAAARHLAERSFWSWDQRLDAEVEAVAALVSGRRPPPGQ
jgi:glycosyltransferase involved in cell wall biosynthesis